MHIVFLADPIDTQKKGIHYYCLNSLKAILKQNKNCKITIIKQNKKSFDPKTNIIAVRGKNRFIRNFWSIPRKIRKLNPDIVVEMAHFGPFNLPENIKRVTVIHDITPIKYPKWHRFPSPILHKILLPKVITQAHKIITPSLATKEDLTQEYPETKDKTIIIPLGAEDIFVPTKDKTVIQKYNLEKPYFLHTGTFEPRKGHLTLLDAYQEYRDNNGKTKQLILVGGKGWKSKKIHKAIKIHPYKSEIKVLGHIPRAELPTLMTQSQAFIFPSLYEGFGLPLLEAMSCGAPCITALNSSLTEAGGSAALYFNTKNSENLSEKMSHIDDDFIRTSLKTASLQQAKNFSWESHAEELLKNICK